VSKLPGPALAVLVSAVALAAGCQGRGPDVAALEAEIRALHRAEIEAHWQKDVDFFTRDLAEDYMAVANGEVVWPTPAETRARFADYLASTTFTVYRDLREPIVGVADDGSQAWSVVEVEVRGTRVAADGTERELHFVCAWLTVYRRAGDRWLRVTDVSTFREPDGTGDDPS
jgi:hypothetical protein